MDTVCLYIILILTIFWFAVGYMCGVSRRRDKELSKRINMRRY